MDHATPRLRLMVQPGAGDIFYDASTLTAWAYDADGWYLLANDVIMNVVREVEHP